MGNLHALERLQRRQLQEVCFTLFTGYLGSGNNETNARLSISCRCHDGGGTPGECNEVMWWKIMGMSA